MAFEYKGYKIERFDESNVCLYHWRDVDRTDKETKVVVTSKEWVRIGYYITFFGAVRRLIDRLVEEANDLNDLERIIYDWQYIQKELDK